MRKGKEFYNSKYEQALQLAKEGIAVNEIAQRLGVSYSCAYMWFNGKKPQEGRLSIFMSFLEKNGPSHSTELPFQKHNEVFLLARNRGYNVSRHTVKGLGTWYFLDIQKEQLKERIEKIIRKIQFLDMK